MERPSVTEDLEQNLREASLRTKLWPMMLNTIQTPEQYRRLVSSIFEDGNTNKGRWLILDIFTKELCARHLDRTQEFLQEYHRCKDEYVET